MRDVFKLHVSILDEWSSTTDVLRQAPAYPVDNVVQIKLSKDHFTDLFRDPGMSTSTSVDVSQRYSAPGLLQRLETFFDRNQYHNYNALSSDITNIILNTHNDIDVNPVALESACCSPFGAIFSYFFKSSAASFTNAEIPVEGVEVDEEYGEVTDSSSLLVFELIARELDNMISRNLLSTSEDMPDLIPDTSYDDLDALYTISEDAFWQNLSVGDSIFIEGSFLVPTKISKSYSPYTIVGQGNLPIVLQFVYSDNLSYGFIVMPTFYLKEGVSVIHDISEGHYPDPGVVALNHEGQDISGTVETNSTIPVDLASVVLGTVYQITYFLEADGYSMTLTRSVTYQDLSGPVLTVDFSAFGTDYDDSTKTLTLEGTGASSYSSVLPVASSIDYYDNTLRGFTVNNQGIAYASIPANTTFVNPNYTGTTNGIFSYTIFDRQNNSSSETYTLVLRDSTAPQMLGSSSITMSAQDAYVDPGFTDAFSGIHTYAISTDQSSDSYTSLSQLEAYIDSVKSASTAIVITYIVTDYAGNAATHQRTVTFE